MRSSQLASAFLLLGIVGLMGAGVVERCRQCHATGRCHHCGGDGELGKCTSCDGSGEVRTSYSDLDDPYRKDYVSCSTCSGSGIKRCFYCSSSGRCRHCVGGRVYGGSPGKGSSTRVTSTRASAIFKRVVAKHNVTRNKQTGMVIHTDFEVYDAKGTDLDVNAYFAFSSGQKLRDLDRKFYTVDGHVSTGEPIKPGYGIAYYNDFQLFIPYSQLHLAKGIDHQLQFHLEILNKRGATVRSSKRFLFHGKL